MRSKTSQGSSLVESKPEKETLRLLLTCPQFIESFTPNRDKAIAIPRAKWLASTIILELLLQISQYNDTFKKIFLGGRSKSDSILSP